MMMSGDEHHTFQSLGRSEVAAAFFSSLTALNRATAGRVTDHQAPSTTSASPSKKSPAAASAWERAVAMLRSRQMAISKQAAKSDSDREFSRILGRPHRGSSTLAAQGDGVTAETVVNIIRPDVGGRT